MRENMGTRDRVLRGIAGGLLLCNGLRHWGKSPFRAVESLIGGATLIYGITGFDPLLAAFGATTIPGAENNVWNLVRSALPGPGIKPILTEVVVPRKPMKPFSTQTSLAEALSIG